MSKHGQWVLIIVFVACFALVREAAGKEPTVLQLGGGLGSLAYSADGNFLAAGTSSNGNQVLVWDLVSGKEYQLLKAHSNTVTELCWAPDNLTLMAINTKVGSGNCVVTIWDVPAAKIKKTFELPGAGGALAVSPGGKFLVTCHPDSKKCVLVWNLETGKKLTALETCPNQASHASFSSDGKTLVACGISGCIKVWHVPMFQEKTSFKVQGSPRELCIAGDGTVVVLRCQGENSLRGMQIWDLTAKELKPVVVSHGIPCGFGADGKTLLALSTSRPIGAKPKEDVFLELWDVAAGKLHAFLPIKAMFAPRMARFSPDGKTIGIPQGGITLHLLQVADFKKAAPLKK